MPDPLRFGTIGRAIFVAHTGKTGLRRMGACFPASFTVSVGKTPSPLAGTGMRTFSYSCIIENG